ncbi:TadE/TadG family type IV pilus assembly protein [Roseovarius autotrophicus]|uniref:TadE/TadG family type IV pilus assembly protein n=1 Tax=Roseovarius autotrophicus TaxID=2824121 RepID=UPI001FFC88F5|nr:TadE/TadG family type IV pilus assembly protein [Roseovarius autotrophicus]
MIVSLFRSMAKRLARLRDDERGVIAVETVVITPFLLMGLFLSFEYYDMFRQKSLMEKATYTVTDALSRENEVIDDAFLDNLKATFDMMVGTRSPSQLRVSVVRFHTVNGGSHELRWSEVRGQGEMAPLSQADMEAVNAIVPLMVAGQDLIMVEGRSKHVPVITNGLLSDQFLDTRMFMTLRFSSQLCFTDLCAPSGTS